MLVLAGDKAGLAAFETEAAPLEGRYPMRLANHAGFHSALQEPVAARGRAALASEMFRQPELPMIDGRGAIWWPGACDREALHGYTLGHQVTETYDFARAIKVAAREFAPDLFIVPGPGTTLGGAVGAIAHRGGLARHGEQGRFQDPSGGRSASGVDGDGDATRAGHRAVKRAPSRQDQTGRANVRPEFCAKSDRSPDGAKN